jgi:dTDP-4-amino-4,6-dideoxygalactose transaminase
MLKADMTKTVRIPFLDLVSMHQVLKDELNEIFNSALDTGGFIGGPMVEAFERDFAQFCEVPYCIGAGSGTDALRFALIAAGVGNGDLAVTVPNTFIATGEAISQAGARPVFVDVDERTYNMDPQKLQEYLEEGCERDETTGHLIDRKLRKRVAAVVPVHLYGQTADMDPILELAERFDLIVIEDACQAHGAEYFSRKQGRWRKAGSMGAAAAFSFYPGKNLGACGEAGAVTTHDAALAARMRMLRDHGQAEKYVHEIEGYNGRLDAIQAGILRLKLRHLPSWTRGRCEAAQRYDELLSAESEIILPHVPRWSRPVFHVYAVRVADRAGLQRHLGDARIGTGIHYPIPLHLQRAYKGFGYTPGMFPVAEKVAAEILSLPMYPGLARAQQSLVAEEVSNFFSVRAPKQRVLVAAASAAS